MSLGLFLFHSGTLACCLAGACMTVPREDRADRFRRVAAGLAVVVVFLNVVLDLKRIGP